MKRLWMILCALGMAVLPLQAQTYMELGQKALAAIEADSLALAEQYIRQAVKLEPANVQNSMLLSNLGTIQRMQRRYEQALESYTLALNITPMSQPILMNRAILYLELGEEDKARVDYSLVLDVDPDREEALLMRAYIYMNQRNYKQAHADYAHLLKLHPRHFNGRLGLATLYQREHKPTEALRELNRMLDDKLWTDSLTARQQAVLYVSRAGVEKDLGQTSAALLDIETALKHDQAQPEAYLMRGQIYLEQGKKKQARQELQKAMSLGIPQSEVRELLRQAK